MALQNRNTSSDKKFVSLTSEQINLGESKLFIVLSEIF